MRINILDPVVQTQIFLIIFLAVAIASIQKDKNRHEMLISHTNEMKGLGVLMVLFCHIGYFLFTDPRFLFPLSIDGGVGVNVFLFLSGFGITTSMIKKPLKPLEFYKKRLLGLYVPMWLVITLFIMLDFLLLHNVYPASLLIGNYLGYFPKADIFNELNSPLWYFSWIILYYLIYPLVFNKKYPSVSAWVLFLFTLLLLKFRLPVATDVQKLYELHTWAFPLGMLFASFLSIKPLSEIKEQLYALQETKKKALYGLRYLLIVVMLFVAGYTSVYSGVGKGIFLEQFWGMVTTLSIIGFFLLKRYKSSLLVLIGVYSYEIYLLQWPLLYRYDFIYKHVTPGLGTALYLILFLLMGWGLNKISKIISSYIQRT